MKAGVSSLVIVIFSQVGVISSVSLSPRTPAKATLHSKYHSFPLGYSALFSANLHDSIGRQFDYADIDLSYRLNRFDIVHVTKGEGNESFVVKAAKQGNAVFKVIITHNYSLQRCIYNCIQYNTYLYHCIYNCILFVQHLYVVLVVIILFKSTCVYMYNYLFL